MQLPEGFTCRPPQPEDGERIVAMMNEETIAVVGVPMASLDWVVTPWTAPGVDLEHDYAVILAPDGGVAGYFFLECEPPHTEVFSIGAVAVPYHGRGLGAAIVAEVERRSRGFLDRAPPGRRVVIHAGALANEPRAAALLSAHGYIEARRFARMQIEFDAAPEPPAPIPGIEIRPLARGEEPAVYACLRDAFVDHWGESWPTEEAWLHSHVDATTEFDPELWLLAWQGVELTGALVGQPRSEEDPALGHIGVLGVRRLFRRRGIAEALLRASFVLYHGRGSRGVALEVDTASVTGATRVYERVGMTAEPRFSQWEKELRPAAA